MKKILVLAAGILQTPVIKKAREMGYYVIAVDGNSEAVGLQFADKAVVANITSEEEMLALARAEKIDGVIHPCSEVAMHVMGRINDEMQLHGISRQIAYQATNKHLMRNAFERYGAPSPQSYCTDSVEEGWYLLQSIPGSAILKPSRNSGSRGIAKIEEGLAKDEFIGLFNRAKAESRDSSVMLEQFIEGPEFSVEIIVSQRKIYVLQVTDKKTTGAPFFVELGHSQPSLFPTNVVDAVRDAAVRGVKALELNDCAAHAEIKYQDAKAYIMEIGARMGGDFISTELTHLSAGVDMVAAAINVALGVSPNLTPETEPQGVAIRYITPKPGTVIAIKETDFTDCLDVYDSEIYVKTGDIVPEVKSSTDRSGHIIVIAHTADEAIRKAEQYISNIQIITK